MRRAVQRWKDLQEMSVYHRRVRTDGEESAWRTLAEGYDRMVYPEDFHLDIAARIGARCKGARTAIEIGAGPGTLTIPLAPSFEGLLVVEPSPSMRAVLAERLKAAEVRNVRILPNRWEDAQVEPADVVIAGGCLYAFYDIDRVILKMVASAKRKVLLTHVGDDGLGGLEASILEALGLPRPTLFPPLSLVLDVLGQLGLTTRMEDLSCRVRRARSMDQWLARFEGLLGAPEERRREIADLLKAGLQREGELYMVRETLTAALFEILPS